MPPRQWRLRIEDMLDSAHAIEEFVEGLDFDAFRNDRKTVDAVVRNIEVIGEAARYVPEGSWAAQGHSVDRCHWYAERADSRILRS